jgi:hypothetical protein
MTLAETIQKSLSEYRPAGAGRQTFAQNLPEWTLTASFDKIETLGGLVWEMELDRTGEAAKGTTLRTWAERSAERVSGLLESLKVYEIDEAHGFAILRSDEPTARGTARTYTEVILKDTAKATVRRYQADTTPGSKRSQIPFAITHESLAKLVEDLAG